MAELEQGVDIEVGVDDDTPEIEIVDDTPEEDRGRAPLKSEEEEHEEELDKHSVNVKKRINQLSHKYHDERRAKEEAIRQNEEAIRIAHTILEENKRLKSTLTWGQQEYVNEVNAKIDYAQKLAEDKYRRAYESGNTDELLAAQKEMQDVAIQKSRMDSFVPPVAEQSSLQTQEASVYTPQNVAPERPQAPPRDEKAEEWAARNPWFGTDEEMSSLAYGLHAKLVNNGVDPQSDEYYVAIDKRMREVYPDYFGKTKPRASSPVAPASRNTAGRKVTLTATQVALAKRLGVPLEQYAKHVAKLEQRNNG